MTALPEKSVRVLGVAQNFRCLAGKCPMTCCAHWNIEVDDITADKLAHSSFALRDGRMSHDGLVRVERETPAWFTQRDAHGHCVFLNERRECEIQAQSGHDALPLTCRAFPRHQRVEPQRVEVSASAGCPEAARLVLQDPQALTWFEGNPAWLAAYRPARKLADSPQGGVSRATLRRLFLEQLDNTALPLKQRVLGMSWLARHADGISRQEPKADRSLDAFVNFLKRRADGQEPYTTLNSLPAQFDQVFLLISTLLGTHAANAGSALGSLLRRKLLASPRSTSDPPIGYASDLDHATAVTSLKIPTLLFRALAQRKQFESRHGDQWQGLEEKIQRYFLLSEALGEYATAELFVLRLCLLLTMIKLLVVMQWEYAVDEDVLSSLTAEAFAVAFRELHHGSISRRLIEQFLKESNVPLLSLSATLLRI